MFYFTLLRKCIKPLFFTLVGAGIVIMLVTACGMRFWEEPESVSQRENNATIQAVTREEKISLVGVSMQGLISEKKEVQVFGLSLPGTINAQFVEYSYEAKLGIDGSQVEIVKLSEGQYRITVPQFIFIGYDQPQFRVAVEEAGLLSWMAPKVDTAQLVSQILDDNAKQELLKKQDELLRAQTRSFYTGIISAVEPQASVEFSFPGQ